MVNQPSEDDMIMSLLCQKNNKSEDANDYLLNQILENTSLVELPFSHEIYSSNYKFKNGLPKIHEHDDHAPRAYGLFYEGRLVLLYTYECDLGDGWEDPNIHNDPPALRQLALQMGANIVKYVFTY